MEQPKLPDQELERKSNNEEIVCKRSFIKNGVALSAALAIGGLTLKTTWEEHFDEKAWVENLEQTLTEEEIIEMKKLEIKLGENFSRWYVLKIIEGDRTAFTNRDREVSTPVFTGFDQIENLEDDIEDTISEGELAFPKGWINGEIDEVIFTIDKESPLDFKVSGLHSRNFWGKTEIYFWPSAFGKGKEEDTVDLYNGTLAHELAHANDWTTDSGLNLLERYRLLDSVYESMKKYYSERKADYVEYSESFRNGTPEGEFTAVKEYWAETCALYFCNPQSLKDERPEDYKLVDDFVKKHEPEYDVFERVSRLYK